MPYGDQIPSVVYGAVRGAARPNYGDGEQRVGLNNGGEVLVAQVLPARTELVRLGNTWTCVMATGSAFTFVDAWPTTRAELVLYNGEPANGKSYVIQSVFMVNISSQAAAQPYVLLGQLASISAPTDNTSQLIFSRSGQAGYDGRAKRAVAVTTMIANKWELLGNAAVSPMTTNLANGILVDLQGSWIVRPGATLGLAGVAGTAAGTAIIGVTWSEVVLTLG